MRNITKEVINVIDNSGLETYGIGKIERKGFKRVIVVGEKLPYGLREKGFINVIPDYIRIFYKLNRQLNKIQKVIDEFGFQTEIQNGFSITGDLRIFVERAGLGSKGANEMILNPEYGANLIFAILFTDCLKLPLSEKIDGVCIQCHRCWDACPGNALGPKGLNVKRCLPYSLRACQKCIDACPIGKMEAKK